MALGEAGMASFLAGAVVAEAVDLDDARVLVRTVGLDAEAVLARADGSAIRGGTQGSDDVGRQHRLGQCRHAAGVAAGLWGVVEDAQHVLGLLPVLSVLVLDMATALAVHLGGCLDGKLPSLGGALNNALGDAELLGAPDESSLGGHVVLLSEELTTLALGEALERVAPEVNLVVLGVLQLLNGDRVLG